MLRSGCWRSLFSFIRRCCFRCWLLNVWPHLRFLLERDDNCRNDLSTRKEYRSRREWEREWKPKQKDNNTKLCHQILMATNFSFTILASTTCRGEELRFESLEQVCWVLGIALELHWLTVIIMDGIISSPLIKSQLNWGKVEFCISIHRLIKVLQQQQPTYHNIIQCTS